MMVMINFLLPFRRCGNLIRFCLQKKHSRAAAAQSVKRTESPSQSFALSFLCMVGLRLQKINVEAVPESRRAPGHGALKH